MKKISLLIMILVVGVNVFALDSNELETTRKLYELGIFTQPRTLLQWQEPIKTIDCASAIIKSLSVANDNIYERELFYSNKVQHQNNRIAFNAKSIDALKVENELLFNLNNELIKEQERQKDNSALLWIALIATNILQVLL